MEHENSKSQGKAGRRIAWLGVAIVVACVAYTAGWYWIAGRIDAEAARQISSEQNAGTDIACADRSIGGYPFRIEMRCSSLMVARPAEKLSVKAGAFRSAAQVYQPDKVIAEVDGPATVDAPGMPPIRLAWDLAHASAQLGEPLPSRASTEIQALAADIGDTLNAVRAQQAELHMRRVEGDLDLAGTVRKLALDPAIAEGRALPIFGLDLNMRIDDGVALVAGGQQSLRGVSGEFRHATVRLDSNEGIEVKGPFSVGEDGLVDADWKLTVVDAAGLAEAFKPAFPEYASQIAMLAASQPASNGGGPPQFTLPVTVRNGEARLAFISLGRIPALP